MSQHFICSVSYPFLTFGNKILLPFIWYCSEAKFNIYLMILLFGGNFCIAIYTNFCKHFFFQHYSLFLARQFPYNTKNNYSPFVGGVPIPVRAGQPDKSVGVSPARINDDRRPQRHAGTVFPKHRKFGYLTG
jgi:hypothetical protein